MKKILDHSLAIDTILFLTLCVLFMFTRIFAIQSSLLYFNDMGRDSMVLLDWMTSHKPPLLGPQTSALPFNQSAIYFYTLFPTFLMTGGSPFSAAGVVVLYYLTVFGTVFWLLRRDVLFRRALLLVWGLVIIHPQFIIQNRFVWNPSFVGPMMVVAVFSFLQLTREWQRRWVFLLGGSLALATAYSYSSAPVVIVMMVASLFLWQRKALWIWLAAAVGLLVANLPTLVFELRHQFLLTHQLLYGDRPPQPQLTIPHRLRDFIIHMMDVTHPTGQLIIVVVILGVIGFFLWQRFQQTRKEPFQLWQLSLLLFLGSVAFQLLTPIGVHAHYIFGPLILLFITLAFFPKPGRHAFLVLLGALWLVPLLRGVYFRPASRTVAQMEACFARFCQQEREPIFVSVQSDFHPFHNGPEHRFLMQRAGCQVKDIETEAAAANRMAVVLDDSEYTDDQTRFNELTLFGNPSQTGEVGRFQCLPNFEVVVVGR